MANSPRSPAALKAHRKNATQQLRLLIKLASLSTLSMNTKSTLKSRCAHSNVMWWNQPFKSPLSSLPLNWVEIWATFLQSVLTKVLPLTSVWMKAIISHTFHYMAAQVVQVQWLVKSTHYDTRCIQWHAVNEQTSRQGQLQHCSFAGAQCKLLDMCHEQNNTELN